MKVLLTGGTGVLSTDIMRLCSKLNFETYVLNRGNSKIELPPNVIHLKANLRSNQEVSQLICKLHFDVVIDFLSICLDNLKKTYEIFKGHCTQFIFISSACVFSRNDGLTNETSLRPNYGLPYAEKKYQCEEWLRSLPDTEPHWTIVRPYITFGETRIPYGVMPLAGYHWTFIGRILANKPVIVWDDGNARVTLTDTRDFAENFVQLFLNEKAYENDVNLIGDKSYTWAEMLEELFGVLNKRYNVVSIKSNKIAHLEPEFKDFLLFDRSLDAVFDNVKLKSIIGTFIQRYTLKESLKRVLDSYIANNFYYGIDYGFDGKMDRLIACNSHQTPSFIDYLDNASSKDKIVYFIHRYFSPSSRRYISKGLRVIQNLRFSK